MLRTTICGICVKLLLTFAVSSGRAPGAYGRKYIILQNPTMQKTRSVKLFNAAVSEYQLGLLGVHNNLTSVLVSMFITVAIKKSNK
jgi:hypothetical protein